MLKAILWNMYENQDQNEKFTHDKKYRQSRTENWRKVSATLKLNNLTAQYCSFLFFWLSCIDCILSKIESLYQLWTTFQQKLVKANRRLVFFKMPYTFCRFIVLYYRYFLPCTCLTNYKLYVIFKYHITKASIMAITICPFFTTELKRSFLKKMSEIIIKR
jgi:hypothetical protein